MQQQEQQQQQQQQLQDTVQPREADAGSTDSGSSQQTNEQHGALDASAHEVSVHTHQEKFEKSLDADRPEFSLAGVDHLSPNKHLASESKAVQAPAELAQMNIELQQQVQQDQENRINYEAGRAKLEREQRKEAHVRNSEKARAEWRTKRDAAKAAEKHEEAVANAAVHEHSTIQQSQDHMRLLQIPATTMGPPSRLTQLQSLPQTLQEEQEERVRQQEQKEEQVHEEDEVEQCEAENMSDPESEVDDQSIVEAVAARKETGHTYGRPVRTQSVSSDEREDKLLDEVADFLNGAPITVDGLWKTAGGALYEMTEPVDGIMGVYCVTDMGRVEAGTAMFNGSVVAAFIDDELFEAHVSHEMNGALYMRWSDDDEWWQVAEHLQDSEILSSATVPVLQPEPEPEVDQLSHQRQAMSLQRQDQSTETARHSYDETLLVVSSPSGQSETVLAHEIESGTSSTDSQHQVAEALSRPHDSEVFAKQVGAPNKTKSPRVPTSSPRDLTTNPRRHLSRSVIIELLATPRPVKERDAGDVEQEFTWCSRYNRDESEGERLRADWPRSRSEQLLREGFVNWKRVQEINEEVHTIQQQVKLLAKSKVIPEGAVNNLETLKVKVPRLQRERSACNLTNEQLHKEYKRERKSNTKQHLKREKQRQQQQQTAEKEAAVRSLLAHCNELPEQEHEKDREKIMSLAELVEHCSFRGGDTIIARGDVGEVFYLAAGVAEEVADDATRKKITKGLCFGLMRQEGRKAPSVQAGAGQRCICWKLRQEAIDRLKQDSTQPTIKKHRDDIGNIVDRLYRPVYQAVRRVHVHGTAAEKQKETSGQLMYGVRKGRTQLQLQVGSIGLQFFKGGKPVDRILFKDMSSWIAAEDIVHVDMMNSKRLSYSAVSKRDADNIVAQMGEMLSPGDLFFVVQEHDSDDVHHHVRLQITKEGSKGGWISKASPSQKLLCIKRSTAQALFAKLEKDGKSIAPEHRLHLLSKIELLQINDEEEISGGADGKGIEALHFVEHGEVAGDKPPRDEWFGHLSQDKLQHTSGLRAKGTVTLLRITKEFVEESERLSKTEAAVRSESTKREHEKDKKKIIPVSEETLNRLCPSKEEWEQKREERQKKQEEFEKERDKKELEAKFAAKRFLVAKQAPKYKRDAKGLSDMITADLQKKEEQLKRALEEKYKAETQKETQTLQNRDKVMPRQAKQATSVYKQDAELHTRICKALQKKEEQLDRAREEKYRAETQKPETPHRMPRARKYHSSKIAALPNAAQNSDRHSEGLSTKQVRRNSPTPKPSAVVNPVMTESELRGKQLPCLGDYKLRARAAGTTTRDKKSSICHLHEEGETIQISEVWMSVDGHCRGLGPHGWVSFNNERGKVLLELAEDPIGLGLTKQMWHDFCVKYDVSEGEVVESRRIIPVAARELLEDAQPQALAPAYHSIDIQQGMTTIERTQLERFLLHYIYLSERWSELEELRTNRGDKLSLEDFTHCCRVLSYPISDQEATTEFEQLALDEHRQMNFAYDAEQDRGQLPAQSLCFHSWIAHHATEKQSLESQSVRDLSQYATERSAILFDGSSQAAVASQVLDTGPGTFATPSKMPPIPPEARAAIGDAVWSPTPENGGRGNYKLLIEPGELVDQTQPLVVTCDACRSLDELIAQLHYKLKIPPERKFAIFTELAEDGINSISQIKNSERIQLRLIGSANKHIYGEQQEQEQSFTMDVEPVSEDQ